MTCHTDYQPKSIQSASLKQLVLSGLTDDHEKSGWHYIIYEDLVDKNLVQKSKRMGYLDYKYLMYATATSQPLSLALTIAQSGPVFICQTPGIWGSLPKGYNKLWESELEVYITYNTNQIQGFTLNKGKSTFPVVF
jgi:hypothetical protein